MIENIGKLFNHYFDEDERKLLIELVALRNEDSDKEYKEALLKYDQSFGGLGIYCVPIDPLNNPFSHGKERELYRPMQYLKFELLYSNSPSKERHIIDLCGLYLEAITKCLVEEKSSFISFGFRKMTLGRAANEIRKMHLVENDYLDGLFAFVDVYNMAKHNVNVDDERSRLFTFKDALVMYFFARKIGKILLNMVEDDYSDKIFEIDYSTI